MRVVFIRDATGCHGRRRREEGATVGVQFRGGTDQCNARATEIIVDHLTPSVGWAALERRFGVGPGPASEPAIQNDLDLRIEDKRPLQRFVSLRAVMGDDDHEPALEQVPQGSRLTGGYRRELRSALTAELGRFRGSEEADQRRHQMAGLADVLLLTTAPPEAVVTRGREPRRPAHPRRERLEPFVRASRS